ncbi:hypothetical protein D3C80_1684450 [compost metagenome]
MVGEGAEFAGVEAVGHPVAGVGQPDPAVQPASAARKMAATDTDRGAAAASDATDDPLVGATGSYADAGSGESKSAAGHSPACRR